MGCIMPIGEDTQLKGEDMERDLEQDLVDYIMGLWHQRRIQKYLARK